MFMGNTPLAMRAPLLVTTCGLSGMREIDHSDIDWDRYKMVGASLLLALEDNLMFQRRTDDAPVNPGMVSAWSGGRDPGEELHDIMPREMDEENGIKSFIDYTHLATHEVDLPNGGTALSARYFARTTRSQLGRCMEGRRQEFRNATEALAHPKLQRPGTEWSIRECLRRGLIN